MREGIPTQYCRNNPSMCCVNRGDAPRDLHSKPSIGLSRGQELIEFAIALPLLILIVFGVLDLGRMFYSTITITNAAREGARYAMNYPADMSGATPGAGTRAAVRREAQNSGINLNSSSITIDCTDDLVNPNGCDSGLPVRVTVQYDFHLIFGAFLPNSTIQITRYAEMMVP